jgi:hypothetical protein
MADNGNSVTIMTFYHRQGNFFPLLAMRTASLASRHAWRISLAAWLWLA